MADKEFNNKQIPCDNLVSCQWQNGNIALLTENSHKNVTLLTVGLATSSSTSFRYNLRINNTLSLQEHFATYSTLFFHF